MNLLRMYTFTGTVVIAAAASSLLWIGRHKKTPEQRETLRRQRINAEGRITDGTVLDVQEFDSGNGHFVKLVMYTYDVAGVQYECSQDVAHLHRLAELPAGRIGVTASVKYDPHNPGNSIVVAETWCGLRT